MHAFFERALNALWAAPNRHWAEVGDNEHVSFELFELYVTAIAMLMHAGRGSAIARLVEPFSVGSARGVAVRSPAVLGPAFRVLQDYSHQIEKKPSINAGDTLLRDRAGDPSVEQLLEAEVFLWVRTVVTVGGGVHGSFWWPHTLWGARDRWSALPTFARMRVGSFFDRFAAALGLASHAKLRDWLDTVDERLFPKFGDFPGTRDAFARLLAVAPE